MTEARTDTAGLQGRRLKLGDTEIELHEGGSGRPLLFLHGGDGPKPGSHFLAALARKFRVVAPTHPGFGTSDLPDWLDSIDDYAHLYVELIDRLELERPVLVGASIGGWIAAELATKSLNRLDRLVLISPVGIKVGPVDRLDIPDIFAMPYEKLNQLVYHDPAKSRVDLAGRSDAELAIHFRNQATLALVTWEPYMHNPKLKHRLHAVDTPTLLLRGASDGMVSDAYARAYAGLIPGAVLHTIPEAGHAPQSEQPEATARAILNFCQA